MAFLLVALTTVAHACATSTTSDPGSPIGRVPTDPELSVRTRSPVETESSPVADEPSQEPQQPPDSNGDDALRAALQPSATAESLAHLRELAPALFDASCSPPGILPLRQWLSNHPADGVRSEAACLDGRCVLAFTSIGARTAVEFAVFYHLIGESAGEIRCEVRQAG